MDTGINAVDSISELSNLTIQVNILAQRMGFLVIVIACTCTTSYLTFRYS